MQKFSSLWALTFSLLATGPALAQRFEVTPANADIVAGEPLQIRLSGLPANAEVSLSATRAVNDFSGTRRLYASEARYTASAAGTLDLATAAPLSGSYAGADLRGLAWAMVPMRAYRRISPSA